METLKARIKERTFESDNHATLFLSSIWDGRLTGQDHAQLLALAKGRVDMGMVFK